MSRVGSGVIYTHVRLLCANGIDAAALYLEPGLRPAWMAFDVFASTSAMASAQWRSHLLAGPEEHAAEFGGSRRSPKSELCSRRRVLYRAAPGRSERAI